jgi:hypothetical protein
MAAGAIPPPLFFEWRRMRAFWLSKTAFSGTPEKHPASIMQLKVWQALARRDRSPPKDI